MDLSSPVAVVLAFANDWRDPARLLRHLIAEGKAIDDALAPLVRTGGVTLVPPIYNATFDEVTSAFRDPARHGRIRVFHFGGHASGAQLLFEDEQGAPAGAHANGLASYLGQQPGLVLVFLNGCCTEPQVRRLREVGVKAVVATTSSIKDGLAAEFATAFYAELATRPLQAAFATAVAALRARVGDDPRAATRDVGRPEGGSEPPWPWLLDCDPRFESWTLRPRHRWLLTAALLALATVTAVLVISPGARRVACGVPGVRAACDALGVERGPSPGEVQLWAMARSQQTGDGLRAYLRAYPASAFAVEARSRLAGCQTTPVETLAPERAARFPLTVTPIRSKPLATEQEARRDAIERGQPDADNMCAPLGLKGELQGTAVEARVWRCEQVHGSIAGWACGFDGDIVCRVRDRVVTREERCLDPLE